MSGSQNYINHVALVLDASSSMSRLSGKVVEVADEQIAYLARRSQELDQETRVTVYVFADQVECVIYDKDVLRMPSLKQMYRVGGMTALLAATLKSQRELAQTAQLYGDHSFLTFVLTDGQENASHRCTDAPARDPRALVDAVASMIETQEDNWTLAVLVPDQMGRREAMQYGFPKDNVAIWDATSTQGLQEAGQVIQEATEKFMIGRSKGIRGSRAVFSTGADAVNKDTIKAAGLKPVDSTKYQLVPVTRDAAIRDWVVESGHTYRTGGAYYQLSKSEKVQPKKQISVLEKKTDRIYTGPEARALLGLPDVEVRIKPDHNDEFTIFVQSTSVNRKLVPNTRLLLML
ncbi:vWA domain-containing protein [Streptomyces olivaceus]|uniref:vWA domain-containing protein n=1 Tax=Streptomyces TaxID=1883 RepID=UPI001CC9EADC|nr:MULTISPECIES: vWA domain-containing protein [Streptomyces]MBZ6135295.1 VWA domain-containing protein [Streptomyces olivaceus]MBZ6142013.1 VWA domain-containing protein [Streptomyces olivaceus]MBZ6169784.1 VWA domain-containing protein [Streptomyces olivaceus]MBZ6176668.1 VWA domain-containing protein [Streptomyces olivaceus]MBZ6183021.1 VWA domain-containing protein [Streptomyces olivaceus]